MTTPSSQADLRLTDREEAERLYELARALPPAARLAFIEDACRADAELRAELASLLEHAEAAEIFFARLGGHLPGPVFPGPSTVEPNELSCGDEALAVGRSVSHYAILGHIARGGMGTVYRARDLQLNREVALKFLPSYLSPPLDAEQRLLVEARAAAALEHPNVCSVHEIGQAEDGRPFIAMAFYPGETLKERLTRGPMLPEEAVAIAAQVARGLGAAHARGIIHRDVKPGNVMLGTDGTVRLLDFGLAKVTDVTLTGPGATPGTVAYMSPEQARGDPVDHRTDLWSLGVVLYEMLTATRPFRAGNDRAVLQAILHQQPEPVSRRRPETPQPLCRIVERLLQKEPARRHRSADELLSDLALALPPAAPARRSLFARPSSRHQPAGTAPKLAVVTPPAASWRRHRGTMATLALVAAGLSLAVAGAVRSRASLPLAPRRVAVAAFENRTGRPDLDDLGSMAADWITRGLIEMPLTDVNDFEAVHTSGRGASGRPMDARTLGRRNGAGIVIAGSYHRSGDSVLFQAALVDVASGRILRSLQPIGGAIERPAIGLELLRQRVAGAVGAVIDPRFSENDPDEVPTFAAYRELVAGLERQRRFDWKTAADHFRRAAELDTTFVTPATVLALQAVRMNRCEITDSIGTALDRRRDQLSAWNRIGIDALRAFCRGDMVTALRLSEQRLNAYPRSKAAQLKQVLALQHSNQPRAAREILRRLDPERDLGWLSPQDARGWYWWFVAASDHMLGDFRAELGITDRWRDSMDWRWPLIRGRALGALGREREVFELLRSMATRSIDTVAAPLLTTATELAAHGHPDAANAVAESVLARLELTPAIGSSRIAHIARANRLLGRTERERAALEQLAESSPDTSDRLDALGRIAVLIGDTAQAERMDSILAEKSRRALSNHFNRAAHILARAHIAVALGRRQQAVILLKEASTRGWLNVGPSYALHEDLLLAPLRGYPPFDALLTPDN